jgi:hypothetical protein
MLWHVYMYLRAPDFNMVVWGDQPLLVSAIFQVLKRQGSVPRVAAIYRFDPVEVSTFYRLLVSG